MATETAVESQSLEIPVDAEHGALRLTVVALLLVIPVIIYIVVNRLFPVGIADAETGEVTSNGINVIAILVGLSLSAILTQFIETWLKKRWRSGRVVQLDQHGVRIQTGGAVQAAIDGQHQVNFLSWRFTVKKRSRVRKGWYVVACALEQDGVYLPVYTFMSPQQFEGLKMREQFVALMHKKDLQSQQAERDLRLAGQQRRLHTAEQARWMSGAEMSLADFEVYLSRLQTLFPKWMPRN